VLNFDVECKSARVLFGAFSVEISWRLSECNPAVSYCCTTSALERQIVTKAMNKEFQLGRLVHLQLSAISSAFVGSIGMWIILSGVALAFLQMSLGEAIVLGFIAVALHWVSDMIHQFGHAWAAARTGNPMTGVRLWGLLSSSVYPADEKPLPAANHIRRALGGVTFSLPFTLVAGVLVLALARQNVGGAFWWLALFLFLDNLLVFTLGSLLPLSFSDGGTLLHWWGKP
jgi:hypothetical protein